MTIVLFLDADWQPLRVEPWTRAITDLFLGKVEVIEYSRDRTIKGVTRELPMPAVVRVLRRFRRDRQAIRFSRVNIYTRDGFACQYCGKRMDTEDLTFDHVIPRGRRTNDVGEHRGLLRAVQPCQGKPDARAGRHAPAHASEQAALPAGGHGPNGSPACPRGMASLLERLLGQLTTPATRPRCRSCPRGSSGRAPPSEGGDCRFESGRGRSGPVAQLGERRSRKAEIRGASPLGSTAPRSDWTDTRVLSETVRVRIPPGPRHFWRRYVGIHRSFVEPRTDGYLVRPHGQRGSNPRRLLRFGGVAQLGE